MVYILLPVHNRKKITLDFIKSLNKQTYKKIFLILIDDGSTDGTADAVIDQYKNTHVIYGNGNLWWAGSLQKGYEYLINNRDVADDDFVLIINDDTKIKKDYVQNGVKIMGENPQCLLGSIAISEQNGRLSDAGKKIDWKRYKIENIKDGDKIGCLSTRGLFMKYESFKNLGGFHPKILPHYLSDYEYTIRASEKDYNLICDKTFFLLRNEETTGIHSVKNINKNIFTRLKIMFSPKYAQNPFYVSIFILLRCPLRYKFINILKIWLKFVYLLFEKNHKI